MTSQTRITLPTLYDLLRRLRAGLIITQNGRPFRINSPSDMRAFIAIVEEAIAARVEGQAIDLTDENGDVFDVDDEEPDDLMLIDGLGPRGASALINAGITTFTALASLTPDAIKDIMQRSGVRTSKSWRMERWPDLARDYQEQK